MEASAADTSRRVVRSGVTPGDLRQVPTANFAGGRRQADQHELNGLTESADLSDPRRDSWWVRGFTEDELDELFPLRTIVDVRGRALGGAHSTDLSWLPHTLSRDADLTPCADGRVCDASV